MSGCFRSFAIIPAAGESRRMGTPKLLLPWGKSTVIETLLSAWLASQINRVVVVIRAFDEPLEERLRSLDVDVAIADPSPPDMKASVCVGLNHVCKHYCPAANDACLLAPADMPQLPTSIINAVLSHYDPDSPAICVPTIDGKRGHPLLVPVAMMAEIEHLPSNEGLNALLNRLGYERIECGQFATAGDWRDLDTPRDYLSTQ